MTNKRIAFSFTLYFFGFLLLWEWLRPLNQITDTGEIHYFVIFIAFSLLVNYLPLFWWISYSLKAGFILYFLHAIFNEKNSSFLSWLVVFFKDMVANLKMLLSGNIYDLSDIFRSVLFFILLWIMTYLLQYWLMIRKRIFVFYFMTIIYVGVLDTFTKYDGEWAIVRITAIGFILLGILFFQRLLEKEQIENRQVLLTKWMIPLAIMVVASITIGFASPKAGPIWPDPVPFIQSKAENVMPRKNSISTIGYGIDDSRLGGPFKGDDRVVFEVRTPSQQYWRVETKDIYTGKGWKASKNPIPQRKIRNGKEFILDYASITDEPIRKAIIDVKIPYPHIVVPYGFLSVHGNEDGYFQFDPDLNKISTFTSKDKEVSLKEYEMQYRRAAFSMKELRGTKKLPDEPHFEGILEQYTQLPESLPIRVRELAEQLIEGQDNWFDQTKAIERYFRSGAFVYDQTNVAIPEEDEDYVDQFLFETYRGYCDNFSTSMVTLLRAVNIPARWAKGYTAGNYNGLEGTDNRIYQVTNNDAHSWVEVFFPTQGWVPFEPTRSFDNYTTFLRDEAIENTGTVTPTVKPAKPVISEAEKPKPEISKKKEIKTSNTKWPKIKSFTVNNKMALLFGLLAIVALGFSLFWNRGKWIPHLLLWSYKRKSGGETFVQAYEDLLKQLDRFGVKREIGQTLREYAAYVDRHFDSNDMSALTELYERAIYRGDYPDSEWEYASKLWENLIKKATG
ncbi:transglutaminaseTgpA domain-containing protein [Lederbergia citrea]|uniref:DUF4129 domain-containing protein n=1 Tax=Lederbergia citrea TaxID=2833581 RepID=A0A942UW03_9BACI|nr:DUF4129 domain-containing protein [Lederbergia citrea]MBS4224914.1 DUF4129 domain-containing protein [Lederbergia citrea]